MFLFLPYEGKAEDIIHKTRIVHGGEYIENVFYKGREVIARYKTSPKGDYDYSGEIPDGKIKFIDENTKTYGEEIYKKGKKNGVSKTYYENGELKAESYYFNGKILSSKEYYPDGKIRFEVNYEDARENTDSKENGEGKLYYPNGKLKYEWQITKSKRTGFKKSYNQDGGLRAEVYVDENGKTIEKR